MDAFLGWILVSAVPPVACKYVHGPKSTCRTLPCVPGPAQLCGRDQHAFKGGEWCTKDCDALADPLCLSSIHSSSLERKQSRKESKWLPLPLTHMLPPAPSTASHCSCTRVWVNYFLHLAVRVFYCCHSREQSLRGRAWHRELTSPKWHTFLLYTLVTFSINCHTILPLLKIYKILPVLSFSFRMLWIISTNYENKCFPTGLHIANCRPALAAACVGPRLQIWTELPWGSWGGPLPFPVSPLLPQLHRCSVSQLLSVSAPLHEPCIHRDPLNTLSGIRVSWAQPPSAAPGVGVISIPMLEVAEGLRSLFTSSMSSSLVTFHFFGILFFPLTQK